MHLAPEKPEHTWGGEEKPPCWEGVGVEIQSGVGAAGNGTVVR